MYENTFNNIEKTLRAEDGVSNELDYVEQISWVLFLKYLSDYESDRRDRSELEGKSYTPLLDDEYTWGTWASPKDASGAYDHNAALTGDDLIDFIGDRLFPYLGGFKKPDQDPQTIEYKVGEVFSELRNKFRSGYILRDVLEAVDGLSFNTQDARHELSELYETRIKRMGNAGRNGGEYYTPRPLIRAMIKVLDPKVGETVYDGAVGSAGFLCEAWDYMRQGDVSAKEFDFLQSKTFFGQEKKSLAYIIGIINMILHGVEAPNLIRSNTLNENVMDIQDKDRHDVILANPPFGGGERKEVQHNFPIPSSETAYLFMQHFIRKLKTGGRAAIVIKNTFLSNDDAKALRKEFIQSCNLHSILDCPSGVYAAGVKTVVLFFEKGRPTKDIWYYQLDPGRSLNKTNPLNDNDLAEFVSLQLTKADSERSWMVSVDDINEETYDMSVKNPNAPQEAPLRVPEVIIGDMAAREEEIKGILDNIRRIL